MNYFINKKALTFLVIPIFLLILNSCKKEEDAEAAYILSFNIESPAKRYDKIHILFSRNVVNIDSLNIVSNEKFFTFYPEVEGKYVWEDVNKLVFIPEKGYPVGQRITAKINREAFLKYGVVKNIIGESKYEFDVESFYLKDIQYFFETENNQPILKLNLKFSYKVDPIDLKEKMYFLFKGEILKDFSIVQKFQSEEFSVSLTDKKLFSGGELEIKFQNDFISVETQTPIIQSKKYSIILSDALKFKIENYDAILTNDGGKIIFYTNQAVNIETLKNNIKIDPNISFSVSQESRGFSIQAKFSAEVAYKVIIDKEVKGLLGGKLEKDFSETIVFSDMQPDFFFADDGNYLALSGNKKIIFNSVNYDKFIIEAYKIFSNNIEYFFSLGSYNDWEYDEDADRYYQSRFFNMQKFGYLLRVDTIEINSTKNRLIENQIDFSKYSDDKYKGIYAIRLYPLNNYWKRKEKIISISDIGLIVKNSKEELFIFAINANTLQPLKDINIKIISESNQVLVSDKTNSAGIVRISKNLMNSNKDAAFKEALILAESESDFNFLRLEDSRVESSRFDVGGLSVSSKDLILALSSHRDIYRPGERIYVYGILRDKNYKISDVKNLKLYLVNPQEKIIAEKNIFCDNQGMFETSFETKDDYRTGKYKIIARKFDQTFLQSANILLEDFVPERLRVETKFDSESLFPGYKPKLKIKAEYFFGQKAAGRNFESNVELRSQRFVSKKYPDYVFANYFNEAKIETFDSRIYSTFTGELNENGEANLTLEDYSNLPSIGYLEIIAKTAVFDETNRPVYSSARTKLYNNNFLIGIKSRNPYFVSPGYKMKVSIVALDSRDEVKEIKNAKFSLIRKEWRSALRNVNGRLRYVSESFDVIEFEKNISFSGETEIEFSPKGVGEYFLLVGYEKNKNILKFESYSWGAISSPLFKVNPEAQIDIALDKEQYLPGDNVKALLKLPFDGKVAITIERDKTFDYYLVDSKNLTAEFNFKIQKDYYPNIYISAILIRSANSGDFPLKVGYGYQPVFVKDPEREFNINLAVPKSAKPEKKVKIGAEAPRGSNLLILCVDAGILQITKFNPLNPNDYFSQKRSLEVETYNSFKSLIFEKNSSSVGGDEDLDYEMSKRAASLGVKRFNPTSFWSGILNVGSSGKVETEIFIPEFNGELQVFAIGVNQEKFGFAHSSITVSDDILISVSAPRFLTGGDSTVSFITIFNNSNKKQNVYVECKSSENVNVYDLPKTIEVNSFSNKTIEAIIAAKNVFEVAKLIFSAKAEKSISNNTIDILIRNKFPYSVRSESGYITNAEKFETYSKDDFYEFNRSSKILLTEVPIENFADRLLALSRYPYGCLEQTISIAFPQIYLKDIAQLLIKDSKRTLKSEFYIKEAIEKVERHQLSDGAFRMWSEDYRTYDWISVYAAHFLIEAQKAGYSVDKKVLDKALAYVKNVAKEKKQIELSSYGRSSGRKTYKADKSTIYALYVLALAGVPEFSTMNFYKFERSLLTSDTKAILAAAFALIGDRLTFGELISSLDEDYFSSDPFDSQLRSRAIIFSALAEIDPYHPATTRYLRLVSKDYASNKYFTTQEDAFILCGVGKIAKRVSAKKIEANIFIDSKKYSYNGGNMTIEENLFGKNIKIEPKTSGQFYFSIIKEGFPREFVNIVENKGIRVERTYLDAKGNLKTKFSINDLVVVKLTISSQVGSIDNIAITDLLPACLEIENPRLTEYSKFSFDINASNPNHIDIRDDKIIIYLDLQNNFQNYYYLARVVSKGKFYLPPIFAEAMYMPDIRSQGEEKNLIVE